MANSPHKKVLLYCYMRGGSTFFSQHFINREDILFWYEPLGPLYNWLYGTQPWVLPQDVYWAKNQSAFLKRYVRYGYYELLKIYRKEASHVYISLHYMFLFIVITM